jgi:hypothetical protein
MTAGSATPAWPGQHDPTMGASFGSTAGYGLEVTEVLSVQLLHRPKISRWC